MEDDKIWFVQDYRFVRPYAVHWKGWAVSILFVVIFFAIAAFFISLNPFQPLNVWLLFLWWLSVVALMLASHLIARSRTERRWKR